MSFGVTYEIRFQNRPRFHASVEVPGKMRRGQELGMKMGFHFQHLDSK